MRKLSIPLLLLVLGLTACAYKEDTGAARLSDTLTVREIREVPVDNVYDVVRRLRPSWLRVRSAPTPGNPTPERPVVYVDGVQSGSAGVLRNIRRDDVVRLEYLDPNDATNRYGTGHTSGAILVTTG